MIIDYYKMYKKKGLIKIFKYFYEAHLYDLIYNIETHYFNNKKKNFTNDSLSTERDVRNYISYQVSWTSEIRRSFDFLNKYFKKNSFHFKNFALHYSSSKVITKTMYMFCIICMKNLLFF